MGRGRQKAKHTKIARELKSYSPDVNFSSLERELRGGEQAADVDIDNWSDYADYDSTDESDERSA
ncbi:DUF3073 domain-containing protein [Agrococcus casei]|uniref:DUF3073 domain-containing protein n=1 Tax=Agrococcus casei TaxID=343512 RepID=UPI000B353CB4|nr:DUF3073 domain-containing protein [Agrococcus casei]